MRSCFINNPDKCTNMVKSKRQDGQTKWIMRAIRCSFTKCNAIEEEKDHDLPKSSIIIRSTIILKSCTISP